MKVQHYYLPPLGGIVIGRVCWFVCLLRSVSLLEKTSPVNMRFGFIIRDKFSFNCSEVILKVQGQNRRAQNVQMVIARRWFKISSLNLSLGQMSFWHEI